MFYLKAGWPVWPLIFMYTKVYSDSYRFFYLIRLKSLKYILPEGFVWPLHLYVKVCCNNLQTF